MKSKQRLQERYIKEIAPKIAQEFGIKNPMSYPKVVKVVLNMGVGQAVKNKEILETLKKDLAAITGQLPSVRRANVSIASFGIRAGMPVGLAVTLRGDRMYAFLDRLFSIVLPRLRDFRGAPLKNFDQSGNYTLGMSEQTIFPELEGKTSTVHGLEIVIVTNTKDKEKSKRFLEELGMPFEKS
ncbi:50S ribosomal protein L5 [Patescibacteria group bacterium]|nr:50S ribosomal protein L5 [Patescibacteria group bacterium]